MFQDTWVMESFGVMSPYVPKRKCEQWDPIDGEGDCDPGELSRVYSAQEASAFVIPSLPENASNAALANVWTVMAGLTVHAFIVGCTQKAAERLIAFMEWCETAPLDLRPAPRPDGLWPPPNVWITG